MSDNVTSLPNRGKTLLTGAGRTLASTGQAPVGARKSFKNINPSTGLLRDNTMVDCILVRNVSGTTLYKEQVVRWKSGSRSEVDAKCYVDFVDVAGVVDEHLGSAGCPNYDCCWIAVKGQSLVKTSRTASDAEASFAVNQPVVALTAATSQATTAGRVWPAGLTTTVTTIMSIAANRIGKALSATTSANTDYSLLVNLDIA